MLEVLGGVSRKRNGLSGLLTGDMPRCGFGWVFSKAWCLGGVYCRKENKIENLVSPEREVEGLLLLLVG